MGDARSEALLVEIEKKLREWLKDGVVLENVSGAVEAEEWTANSDHSRDDLTSPRMH